MKPSGILSWDINEVAQALKLDALSVREYFTDGRRVAFLIERRIAVEQKFKLASSEGAAFDLIDGEGGKWEARNITRGGIYFCPSCMVGSSRFFDETGFRAKLAGIKGYVLADIELFPCVAYWIIGCDVIQKWWETKKLGAGSKISRERVLRLIDSL